jgi:hypothetical protein
MREFNALRKVYDHAGDEEWLRTSIIATSIINPNITKKSDRLKLDHFVPKRSRGQSEPKKPTSDPLAVLARIRAVQAQIDAGVVKFPKAK